jgi:hypothetical protein
MKLIGTACKTVLFITGFIIFYGAVVFALSSIDLNGCTLLESLAGNRLVTGDRGQSLIRFRELSNIHDIDILFVGSSHAYRGFDPRLFQARGYTSFNMGSKSQTLMNTYFLLKYYLPRIKPRRILIELFPLLLRSDGYESTLDLLANIPMSWELLEMSLATGNPHAVNLCLLKIVRDHKYPLEKYDQRNITDEIYIPGGFVETSKVREKTPEQGAYQIIVLDRQLRYFSKIIEMAKKYDIPITGVIQPLPDDNLRSMSNYKAIVNDLRNIAAKHEVGILAFDDMKSLDPILDYSKDHHLNKSGVLKFNKALLDRLESVQSEHCQKPNKIERKE